MEISRTADIDFIRTRAFLARHNYIESMDTKLKSFEKKMTSKNFRVLWAHSEEELTHIVKDALPDRLVNNVCFDLDHLPTSLSHLKSIKTVPIADVETRKLSASVLFTQADFAVLETGTLVLLNRKSKHCFNVVPNIFILLDINKLVNKTSDLETILYLKSYYQSQEFLPSDVKFINRPMKRISKTVIQEEGEYDVTDIDITLILYDNGITEILKDNLLRTSLYCIECGMCKSVCPISQYDPSFTPIGFVKHHCFAKNRADEAIFSQTLLCGNCAPVCPLKVPLTDLIIREMELSKKQETSNIAKTFARRKKLNKQSHFLRRYFFLKSLYGKNKMLFSYFRQQADTFFNILWNEKHTEHE